MKRLLPLAVLALCASAAVAAPWRVLVFTRTEGFRHDSIPDGVEAIRKMGERRGFVVDQTEDPAQFNDANLKRYKAVIFLHTTGDVLDPPQEEAFQRYICKGGGYVGIHAASDTEYEWPWYGRMVGAYFASHPAIQDARCVIEDPNHPSTAGIPKDWPRRDEWYNFRTNPRGGGIRILAVIDESTYKGGTMPGDHPMTWCQNYDGGRAWYTAMGHTKESWTEPLFIKHVEGGILSVAQPKKAVKGEGVWRVPARIALGRDQASGNRHQASGHGPSS